MINEAEVRAIVEMVVNRVLSNTETAGTKPTDAENRPPAANGFRRVVIGCDHGGFEMKEALAKGIRQAGYALIDVGTYSRDPVDYPDYAAKVALGVRNGDADCGIMIDGAGIGSSMVANKIAGVRAALCFNERTILNSRVHNDANVLTLGAGSHKSEEALQLALLWLKTAFEGGRHQARIDKMMAWDNNGRNAVRGKD